MDDRRETLRVSIDYGTVAASMAAWITRNGEQPFEVYQIPIDGTANGHRNAPQIVAYTNGEFDFGHKLLKLLKRGDISEDMAMRHLKLYLYPTYRNSSSGQLLREQLAEAGRWDYEIIGEHLKALLSLVKPFFKKNPDGRTADEIDDMKIQLFILVPACWNFSGSETMTAAAEIAGVEICQVVTESRAALRAFDKRAFRRITIPTTVLVAVGGGGTLDCMSADVQPIQPGSDENIVTSTAGINIVSRLAGSEMVNENLFCYVTGSRQCPEMETEGGFENLLQSRNTTLSQLKSTLSDAFKPFKEDFDVDTNEESRLLLDFPDAPPGRQSMILTLTAEQIRGFFEPVIRDWIKTLRSMCTENTKCILLTGGFSHNKYLQNHLQEEFEDDTEVKAPADIYEIEKPRLAMAVQTVFKDIIPMPMPANMRWGLASDEILNPKHHKHCFLPAPEFYDNGRPIRNPKQEINPKRVIEVQEDGETVIYAPHCIDWMIVTVEPSDDDVPQSAAKTLIYDILDDDRPLRVDVVKTIGIARQHETLYDENGVLPDHLATADPWPAFYPPLKELGYDSSIDEQGLKVFINVKIEVRLVVSSREVQLKLKVFRSAAAPKNEEGKLRPHWTSGKVIWSELRSNVIRDNPQQGEREPDSGSELFVPRRRRSVGRPVRAPLESPQSVSPQNDTALQGHPAMPQDDQVEAPQNTSRPVARRTGTSRPRSRIQREAEAEASSVKPKKKQ